MSFRTCLAIVSLIEVSAPMPSWAQTQSGPVLEIRAYTLKAGIRDDFHARFIRESLPLLRGAGIDVVAFGPSLHDRDSYFLMRAFATKEERERAEAAFYSNALWVDGPRNAVLAAIVTYSTVVISVDPQTLRGLRMPTHAGTDSAADVSRLTQLNDDYIDAVKTSNVARFQEILAEDFLCITADGTLLDRAAFLEQAGRPTTVSALQAHDVNVRLLGDTAIVHAATTFTHSDGRPGRGRYTDIWARRNGQWVAVAAQFFRQ